MVFDLFHLAWFSGLILVLIRARGDPDLMSLLKLIFCIFKEYLFSLFSLKDELRKLLDISDHHISLYQLTVERGTHLYNQLKHGRPIKQL